MTALHVVHIHVLPCIECGQPCAHAAADASPPRCSSCLDGSTRAVAYVVIAVAAMVAAAAITLLAFAQ